MKIKAEKEDAAREKYLDTLARRFDKEATREDVREALAAYKAALSGNDEELWHEPEKERS